MTDEPAPISWVSFGNKFGRSVVLVPAAEKNSADRKLFLQPACASIDSECGEFIPPGIYKAPVRSVPMSQPNIVQNDRSKEQGILKVQMKRADPATDCSWSQRQVDLPGRTWLWLGSSTAMESEGIIYGFD